MSRFASVAVTAVASFLLATSVAYAENSEYTNSLWSNASCTDDCGCEVDNCDCCSGGWFSGASIYGELQLVHLEQHSTDAAVNPDIDGETGYRAIVGIEGASGLGFRITHFDYDGVQLVSGVSNGLDMTASDFEITDCFQLCSWRGTLSGGYRYVELDSWEFGSTDVDFDGHGLTVGIEMERDLIGRLGLFASWQYSILFGDDRDASSDYDTTFDWTELQLGLQYDMCLFGRDAFLRAGAEAQMISGPLDDDADDAGMLGGFLSLGVRY